MIRLQEYAEGDIVLNDGELGKRFCILESGTLEVVREGKTLSDIDQPGSIFGELSEILGLKRDAVIRAKTAAKVRHVEESIEDIVSKNPKVSIKLIRTLGRRLYRMNRLATKEMSANDKPTVVSTESDIKILVVDDKPNIVKQLTDIFSKNDWIVQSTADEAGALKICESSSFSAILISMALPADTAVDLRRIKD